jgi:Fe-S-cluster-containing dehydrogenase component/formate-dependent nitrite reductase membrane component NrfD
MNYGFLINNDTCIGCHACSTACKSENEVPLGVQRTWVKSVETGQYPNVTRSFQVTRCNHCANPPCVRICPVTAMYQRDDGIVEFDPDVCIGCKACMQACPYDAIYIDPDSGTAAKCHYCAHKVDLGLEPACVVVCPEHAILAGDLDDPDSEIAQTVAKNKVTVRKPEQGTAPKLYYIGGEDVAMHPTATDRTPETFAWADVLPLHDDAGGDGHSSKPAKPSKPAAASRRTSDSGTALRASGPQGDPTGGPIQIGEGRMAEQMTQVVWNAQHKVPWHWPVPAYLVTKGIAAGLFLILSVLGPIAGIAIEGGDMLAASSASLFFLLVTTALLVYDLERPERFLRIVLRPQWRSWLVRGAYLLIGFSGLVSLWWAGELASTMGWYTFDSPDWRMWVMIPAIPFGIGTAIYTAFLFGQAEGRDLWQSPLLPIHMLVQSVMGGSAFLLILGAFVDLHHSVVSLVQMTFFVSVIVDLAIILLGEFGMPHASEQAARAAHIITKGRFKLLFWLGVIVIGHLLPMAYLGSADWAPAVAVLIGLAAYEHAYVTAPQELPNS